jgi:WD40 repeat protein
LLREGLEKKTRGELAAAQRLFDRARVVLEHQVASKAMLEPTGAIWDASAMAWAADGSSLAVAAGSQIHVLRADDYRETLRFSVDAPPVAAVAFSPDSHTLASSAADRGIALWDLPSGTLAERMESERAGLQTLKFSPDGQSLAGEAWATPAIELWNATTRTHGRTLEARIGDHLPGFRAGTGDLGQRPALFAFSPDGKDLLGIHDGTLALWSLPSSRDTIARVFKARPSKRGQDGVDPAAVAYHPDGQSAASSTEAGTIVLWDVAKGSVLTSVKAHKLGPQVSFSRDGTSLISVAPDGVVRTFAARSLAPIASYDAKMPWVSAAAVHPDGSKAALAGEGALAIQDLVSGKLARPMEAGPAITAIAVSADAGHLALGTHDGTVVVLATATGSLLSLTGHNDDITALAFSRDGTTLVSASRDKTARLWDANAWKSTRVMAHPQPVNGVAWAPDGRTVATGCDDGAVRLWKGDEVTALPASRCPVMTVAFSPDGSMVLANAANGSVLRWNADTHARLPGVDRPAACSGELRPWPNSLATSADGKLIASAARGHAVELWSAQTGELQGTLTESNQTPHVRSVAVSPTSAMVAAACGDKVNLWQMPQKTELPALTTPHGVDTLAFTPDGRFLFGASHRGTVSIWAMPSGRLEASLEFQSVASAAAVSASGLVEWLGSVKPGAVCRLGVRLYPADLCEERYLTPGLLRAVLSGQMMRR